MADGNAITVRLGGAERRLRYDLNAIAEIGERLGIRVRLDRIREDLLGHPLPLSALRTLVWAGLLHEDPTLTETTVGSWITTDNVAEVLAAFFAVFGVTGAAVAEAAPLFGAPPTVPGTTEGTTTVP